MFEMQLPVDLLLKRVKLVSHLNRYSGRARRSSAQQHAVQQLMQASQKLARHAGEQLQGSGIERGDRWVTTVHGLMAASSSAVRRIYLRASSMAACALARPRFIFWNLDT